jgi:flagellar motility protein MotE (MotC chaperone)
VIERPRLLPAVILGAMGLLALKLLAWTAEPYPGKVPASELAFASAEGEVIARAHAPGRIPFDPETTGSVDKPDAKKAEEAAKAAEAEAARAANPANPNNKAAIMNGSARPVSPAERALLERLGERREEIEARMRELEMRERLLDTAEKKLDGRVGDLKQLEGKVEGPKAAAAEEAKAIKNLVIMYEAMKPKDAARVFDRLGHDVLVPVVQQMNPRKMSDVLAAMAPDKAEKLTVALASSGRGPGQDRSVENAQLPGNELPAIAPPPRR